MSKEITIMDIEDRFDEDFYDIEVTSDDNQYVGSYSIRQAVEAYNESKEE